MTTPAAAVPFLYDTVDSGPIGEATSIAVTPDGNPSIAFDDGVLTYAVYNHPVWESEVVWTNSGIWDLSLALDSAGNPAIAVERFGSPATIAVFVKNGTSWDTVYSVNETLLGMPSLKYDSLDNLHLAYLDNVSLVYATDRTGSWITESVPTGEFWAIHPGNIVRNIALAMKPTDLPAIAWAGREAGTGDLYLLYTQKFTSWTTEVVTGREVAHVALDIGAGSTPHIAFEAVSAENLGYAVGPAWDVTIFDTPTEDGWDTGIALDSNGDPHISYRERFNSVRYKFRSGQQWLDQSVESGGSIGNGSSIALDVYDNVHVSYATEWPDRELNYAASLDCNDNGIGDDIDIIVGDLTDCDENGHPDECEAAYGFLDDCNNNGIPDSCDLDCNSNGIPDDCDNLPDCNSNGIPDLCEALPDCNSNGVPDSCDIASGFSEDCNFNGLPDDCDIANGEADCDNNGVLDSCDIESGAEDDCNLNGIPDDCDIASGAPDCNDNGVLDTCDIASGAEEDCDHNLIPDFCDLEDPEMDCTANSILDVCEFGTHLILEGDSPNDRFGDAIAIGDINGDQADDIVVGAWRSNGGSFQAGRIYVFYGGDLADATPDLEIFGNGQLSRMGSAVAVGDVNDDGFDDIIGGAPGSSGGPNSQVRIYLGGANPDASHDFQIDGGPLPGGRIGQSLASGDVDGDGRDDVIIGAPNSSGRGFAFVFRGSNLNGPPFMAWTGERTQDGFARSVTYVGDVNANGIGDVLIGAPGYFIGGAEGRAYLYFGQLGTAMVDGPVLDAEQGMFGFGVSSGGAGDVNGDGVDDFVVGSAVPSGNTGHASLFFGAPTLDTTADLIVAGLRAGAQMGAAVSCNGDLNGDGRSDLILGSPGLDAQSGVAQIYLGDAVPSSNMEKIFSGETGREEIGAVVASLSDLNGDGFDEIVIGAPGYDSERGRVYISDIQPEVCETSAIEEEANPETIPQVQTLVAFPTPFRSQTKIWFELTAASEVVLEVFDTTGRRVATLAQGDWPAGRHSVEWNGAAEGRVLTSGIYFARLTTDQSRTALRMELLK